MKTLLKILGYLILGILLLAIGAFIYFQISWSNSSKANYALLGETAPNLTESGIKFRDLNKNGKLDPYENTSLSVDERVEDLLSQMTLEEKAGSMFITMALMSGKGELIEKPTMMEPFMFTFLSLMLPSNVEMVASKKMNHLNTMQGYEPEVMAKWNNNIQKLAERTRLGIPVTIASDPRHGAGSINGANFFTPSFSHWPTSLGLAATGDTALVEEFGRIAREEYKASGIRMALHPMADLATEPRWARANGTFGEDAELSAKMCKAYIKGFQGDSLSHQSVACMSKHFSGGGPQKDGEDPHFPYGKEQAYPGKNFDYHLIPFEKGVFPAHSAAIMPYYGIPMGQTSEDVAFAFNKDIIKGLLRDKYGFDGVVCTDWNIITNSMMGEGRSWGVENLSEKQRLKKVLDAGCDMFGGEYCSDLLVELVKEGELTEERLDESVRRIMRDKFTLGLFDNPYVDDNIANAKVATPLHVKKGKEAQRKSVIMLKNEDNLLPLKKETKLYIDGIDKEIAVKYAKLVDNPEEADVVIIRRLGPYEPRNGDFLEALFHAGRLYYSSEELIEIRSHYGGKPVVFSFELERPAVLTELVDESTAVLADFGLDHDILMEALFGQFNPSGNLPFELPRTWEAVEKQLEDVPYDSDNPLFPFGYGLGFGGEEAEFEEADVEVLE